MDETHAKSHWTEKNTTNAMRLMLYVCVRRKSESEKQMAPKSKKRAIETTKRRQESKLSLFTQKNTDKSQNNKIR